MKKEDCKKILGDTWGEVMCKEFEKPYMRNLSLFISEGRKMYNSTVYPESKDVFNAFKLLPFEDIKVVIVGQDPYINKGEAHGLAFSTLNEDKTPPSLRNILKEVEDDIYDGLKLEQGNNLERWVKQGVFLINSVLTVTSGKSLSHAGYGWEYFTKEAINLLAEDKTTPKVFIIWGAYAKRFLEGIDFKGHLLLQGAHPAAEVYRSNAGFLGGKYFSKANEFLQSKGLEPIIW